MNQNINLLSSVNSVGDTTTQIIHFTGNIKRTIKGIISESIQEGEMLKYKTVDGRMIIVNKANVLMTEVFSEN